MTYADAARLLHKLGCEERPRKTRGSHREWVNADTGGRATLPDWGPKDIKLGTLRAALRNLGIDWDRFRRG